MTKKLFWDDPYLTECNATVTKVEEGRVWLDQTCFFAFSGGQASDSGSINSIPVKEAIAENSDIHYILEGEVKEGEKVRVEINKEKRKKIMMLHSAAHIVWVFLCKEIGRQKMIGSNIYEEKARLDIVYDDPLTEVIPKLEEQSNSFIAEAHEIKTYPDENDEGKRYWEINDFLKMPCGGTHLKNTEEVGSIKLKRKNIGAGKERIEITLS
jgi:Ser-tRNA(Ala) deacylase AlaX